MPAQKYTTVIFDFGGVLGPRSNNWSSTHHNISKLTGLPPESLAKTLEAMTFDMETGRASVQDFWKKVIEMSPNKLTKEELEEAYEANFRGNDEVFEMAKELKSKDYRVAILSNASKRWMSFKITRFHLREIFDKIYSSASLGMIKPNPEIYKYVLHDLGVAPDEVIFIDDLPENIKAANALGITGIVYKTPERLRGDLKALISNF